LFGVNGQANGTISVAKMGQHKKLLADVQRWQVSYKQQEGILFQFLKWLFGN
jgi:hypothetical protein